MSAASMNIGKKDELVFKILGRTLEHFGVQMYKRRDTAIAELVANCWDAGATRVEIQLPPTDSYDRDESIITICDDGCGMSFDDIRDDYLVLGRNRRRKTGAMAHGRNLMGRKGIGKLAGFGVAGKMTVLTWRDRKAVQFELDMGRLKAEDNEPHDVSIDYSHVSPPLPASPHGTLITLASLKHKSPVDHTSLRISLARRFSRTVRGNMQIFLDGNEIPDAIPALDKRLPDGNAFKSDTLSDGNVVNYWYGFAEETIKQKDLRGFAVLVNGKVAQAPPFFFDVEATASGQHSTKYVVGEIEADFLDSGTDDDSDITSTDRQEIDWEVEATHAFREWGQQLSRRVLGECRDFRGERTVKQVLEDPGINKRMQLLDPRSRLEIRQFLKILGLRDDDDGRTLDLADALVRAYEYRHFHDVIKDIETAAANPEQLAVFLSHLNEWKVLESRAILEVIQGRLHVINELQRMLANDAPETAHRIGDTNLHDTIARFPWLLNPEWQVFSEEKSITKQLSEWADADVKDATDRGRFDFLALGNDQRLVIIEIKRAGHAVTIEELQRLERYMENLSKARSNIRAVLVYGGTLDVSKSYRNTWENSEDRELREWREVFEKSRRQYKRFLALLQRDVEHPDFSSVKTEVIQTRQVIESGTMYRDKNARKAGLGPQDSEYQDKKKE